MRRWRGLFLGGLLAFVLANCPPGTAATPGIRSVEVVGTEFRVILTDGRLLSGKKLVGAVLTVAVPGGQPQTIRIDGIELDPKDHEVTLYDLSFRDPTTGAWGALCKPDAEGSLKAFPMRGTLAPDGEYRPEAPGFSLTCTLGVQAKCVRWGYKPWKPDIAGFRMLDLYRSCMRMARADYCGDGLGATRDGTLIDLYDVAGIQKPEPVSSMRFEAAWGPHGAICVRHTRLPDVLTTEQLAKRCPRLANRIKESCSEDAPGAFLFNKSK
jgi:hypothetical protein